MHAEVVEVHPHAVMRILSVSAVIRTMTQMMVMMMLMNCSHVYDSHQWYHTCPVVCWIVYA